MFSGFTMQFSREVGEHGVDVNKQECQKAECAFTKPRKASPRGKGNHGEPISHILET